MNAPRPSLRSLFQGDTGLRLRQLRALVRVELRRNLITRRGLWIYVLALAPVFIIGMHTLVAFLRPESFHALRNDTMILAGIFQFYYLRLGIFFGCLGIFTWLFRGEIANRSLHYHFLVPMRREVLVAGKFLAGLITAVLVFGGAVLLAFLLMYMHYGAEARAFILNGPGLGHLAAYLGVTVLACIGYGSVFLAFSLVLRNPILPGILVLGWETLHSVFPALLQRLSMTFYLKHLVPVEVPVEGPAALFSVVAEPVAPAAAVLGLLALAALVLVFAARRIWSLEVTYSTE
jgi:ABC-type transport system involved in multi-copper enzyme maturation permease subunit